MQTTSFDPKLLNDGLFLIEGMTLTADHARRNTSLSKGNREFYAKKEAALEQVLFCAKVGAAMMGALHG